MKNNKKGTGRDIIVSCFEVFPYDPEECIWNMEQKCIGEVSVNTKKKTISFKYLGGTAPILYVMLLVMSANKHWNKIVAEYYGTAIFDVDNYSLISRWNDYASTEIFLAHEGESGLPVIEKRSVHIDDIGLGIHECTLTPIEFILFNQRDYELGLYDGPRYKHKLKELRKDYDFRYITDEKAKANAASIEEPEDAESLGFSFEQNDDEEFNICDEIFGHDESSKNSDDIDSSYDLYFED